MELRDLPSVDRLLGDEVLAAAPHGLAAAAARSALERMRETIQAGGDPGDPVVAARGELERLRAASLRRVVTPQRDVVGRLSRREFGQISEALSYRFRDVYDHLVRLADEATLFHDRITSLLDAHLSFTSNRLNQVMKTLTIFSTIFLPLTVLTGMFGMNVAFPHFPGGDAAQFWWIAVLMAAIGGLMLWYFNRSKYR